LAFGLIGAQLLSVIAVHRQREDVRADQTDTRGAQNLTNSGLYVLSGRLHGAR
jgi:hypothetical protein